MELPKVTARVDGSGTYPPGDHATNHELPRAQLEQDYLQVNLTKTLNGNMP